MYRRYYYLRRRKHFLVIAKEYRENHKEYYRKYNKEYQQKNKKRIIEMNKKWHFKNRDRILRRKRKYYYKKREELGIKPYDKWWNKRQDNLLKANYSKFQAKELVSKFSLLKNRSVGSIHNRMRKLNLYSNLMGFPKEKNPMWSKTHSDKTKLKISLKAKKRFKSKNERLKVVKLMKKLWKNPNSIYNQKSHREKLSRLSLGENNPAYKDGLSKFPYPLGWTARLKEQIRQRDGKCAICRLSREKHKLIYNCRLFVHHIDRDKNNLNPFNLISMCQFHHKKIPNIQDDLKDYFYAKNQGLL